MAIPTSPQIKIAVRRLFTPNSSDTTYRTLPTMGIVLLAPNYRTGIVPLTGGFSLSKTKIVRSIGLSSSRRTIGGLTADPEGGEGMCFFVVLLFGKWGRGERRTPSSGQ